ncbi:VanZ family protein [Streptomyces sp. SBT349]|uniref:VanZ family protein n=1 Tax=Streptomyces sp. SBT349 TaxID=1580539 RepID=UPI0007C683F1|nr:VanZ family protein [Streptomyces sp. SBT349]
MARVALFRPAWRTRPRATSTPGPVTEFDGGDGPPAPPRTPVLQRRTWRAMLARAAVTGLALVCMVAFAVALARATLVPSPGSSDLVHTNLRPGASINAYLDQPDTGDTIRQIGGNVLLGVPFGILLPVLFPRIRGLLRVTLFTALVMVMVEIAQGWIVEGRAFDIDDVILNVTGALLGYLTAGRRLGRALHPRRHHWWHRWIGGPPAGSAPGAARDPAVPDRAVRDATVPGAGRRRPWHRLRHRA